MIIATDYNNPPIPTPSEGATGQITANSVDRRTRESLIAHRAIVRERERIKALAHEVERHRVTGEDLAAAAAKERRLHAAELAMNQLTAEQRDVIERTVMGQESLSDWTLERGTSYEAGRRLRARGLEALRKRIEEDELGRPEGRNADG